MDCCVIAGGYIRGAKDANLSEETCDIILVEGGWGWGGSGAGMVRSNRGAI